MSEKSGVVWCTQWLRIVRLRGKMAQFGLMHDLTTEILCQWSNGWVPNLHIRYNMTYSTDLAILTDIYRWNASKNIVSKCMCHGCVTRCLHNTGSLINIFLPQHQFSHSKLSQLAQDGQKKQFPMLLKALSSTMPMSTKYLRQWLPTVMSCHTCVKV